MNVTRALTCHHDAKLSAGRVQTPTLALMTKREDEIEAFLGSYYYSARGDFGLFAASYYPEENSIRFTDDKKAEELKEKRDRSGKVKRIESLEKRDSVPLLYDLTELQRDANTALGFSAKETLDTLQRLYEVHKIVTYPRTDSRYITPDIVPTLKDRVKALQGTVFSRVVDEYLEHGFVTDNPRFVDESKVSDHHAIIPTEEKVRLDKLSYDEKRLWELIALRFLETIGEDYVYSTTTADIDVDGDIFRTRLTLPLKKGYRSVAESSGLKSTVAVVDEGDDSFSLRRLKEGDEVTLLSVRVRKSSTTPPERYTDATLLSAMEHAGRFVEDEELKSNLTSGLGTPATRADIIEKLVQNRYVERQGKYFVPTPKGREVVRLAPDVLKSPELTGKWEGRLEAISKGKEDPDAFIRDIKKMASSLVEEVKNSSLVFSPVFKDGKKCPYCGKDNTRVIDSRPADDGDSIRRRREGDECHKRFTTYEKVETIPMIVIKKDNNRETYDRAKVEGGVFRACHKRPVSATQIEAMIDDVESSIFSKEEREISSRQIGEMVMEKLKDLDSVAYVRFASVYRELKDVNTFMDELKKMLK